MRASVESIASWADEILIGDTGSEDKTPEVISQLASNIAVLKSFNLKWKDHFAETRNEIAKKAKNDWILFIDGDEVLEQGVEQTIQAHIQNQDVACWSLIQRNYTYDHQMEAAQPYREKQLPPGLVDLEPSKLFFNDNLMERLYKKSTGIQYSGRVHESLIPDCRKKGLRFDRSPIVLHHFGRLKDNLSSKLNYYLELSKKKVQEEPDNPASWIELIISYSELGHHPEAFHFAKLAARQFSFEPEVLKTAFQAALRMDEFGYAEDLIRRYLRQRPDDIYATSQLTTALLYQKKFSDCELIAKRLLDRVPSDFVSNFNLGVIYFEKKDWINAKRYLTAALEIKPEEPLILKALERIAAEQQKL